MEIEESKIVEEALEGLTENTRMNCKTSLKQFLKFVNSKEGLTSSMNCYMIVPIHIAPPEAYSEEK